MAEAGDAQAQFYLGKMFAEGRGVAQDETKGANWYRKAAEQGLADGQYHLGVMYGKGQGVAQVRPRRCAGSARRRNKGMP